MNKQDVGSELNQSTNVGLLGEYLKSKRQEKNYTLEKLSQKTKISVNILKSLEADDYEHLPSAAYIKGFVTSYVKVLNLTQDEAIQKMEYTYLTILGKPFPALNHTKLMSQNTPIQQSPASVMKVIGSTSSDETEAMQSPHEVIEKGDSIIQNTKSILPVAIFGLVILIFIGGYKFISSVVDDEVNAQKSKDLGPKIESSSALVKQPEKPVEANKSTTAAATTPATEQKETTPVTDGTFQRNFPTVEFKKAKDKMFSVKTDAPENNDSSIFPDKIKSSMNSGLQNVYIRAVDGNTWLSYKIDNQPIESVIINKGNDLLLQGTDIRLFLGNVNVTKIFYNNYLIETPTKTGVKSLIFPEESNSKYFLPLFPKAKDDILYTAEEYMKRMKLEEEELQKRQQ